MPAASLAETASRLVASFVRLARGGPLYVLSRMYPPMRGDDTSTYETTGIRLV